MKRRWYESVNDVKVREMIARRGPDTDPVHLRMAEEFIRASGSFADSCPGWLNWTINIAIAIYFGGGLIAPFFWK